MNKVNVKKGKVTVFEIAHKRNRLWIALSVLLRGRIVVQMMEIDK